MRPQQKDPMTIGVRRIDRLPSLDRARAGERGITIGDFLVPIRISERLNVRVRHAALIVAGTILIALGAQVSFVIPGNPVPVTGQTFGVLVAGGALGFRRGIAAAVLYVLLGAIGLPLFAQGRTGVDVILGATGGYLVGFVLAAALVGRLAELGWDRNLAGSIGAMLLGELAIYAVGVPWLAATTGHDLGWARAVGLDPFIVGDAVKVLLAAGAFPAAWWVVGRRPGDR
jgi:biotin transport system substrate-specific component